MTKKIRPWAAMACALLLALGVSTAALADTQGTQTLSTTVPDPAAPSWTLNIPANVFIPYEATETPIGTVTVSDVENIPADESILCHIAYTDFASGADTIPLGVAIDWYQDGTCVEDHMPAGTSWFELYDVTVPDRAYKAEVFALVNPADWAAAAPGNYGATVTYESCLYSSMFI